MTGKRNPWLVVVAGGFALGCVLLASLAGYWHYANQLPVYRPPTIVMPVPNAYDDYVAAGHLCRAAGGATVPLASVALPQRGGPLAPPGFRSRRQVEAYESKFPLAQLRAVVARNRPALARLRQGFKKSYRNPPLASFNQMLRVIADSRELARELVAEGKLAEREGRPNDAARSYLDCLRLGVDVPRGGMVIHGLVGIAIQSIGLKALQNVTDRLDGPTAAAAARAMVRLDARAPTAADTLTWEKEFGTISILQVLRQTRSRLQIASMAGSSPGRPPSASEVLTGLRFLFTPKRRMVDNYRAYMDAMIASARRPTYAAGPPPPVPNDPLNQILAPVFSSVRPAWDRRDAQWQLTELELAVRAYKQQHGSMPPSLSALVPAYLPAVLQDPYAPRPMVYRRKGKAVDGK